MPLGSVLWILYWNRIRLRWPVYYYCPHQCIIKLSITTNFGRIGLPLIKNSTKLKNKHAK